MSTNNSKNNKNFEIPFKLRERLKNEGIIRKFVKDKKNNCIIIELGHKYGEKKVIIPINKDLLKFHDTAEKILEFKGVNNKDISLITDVFDDNYELVIQNKDNNDNLYTPTLQQEEAEQEQKEDEYEISIRKLMKENPDLTFEQWS